MKSTSNKKKWVTPMLTVIAKSKPEESVLFACKVDYRSCGKETGPTSDLAPS